MKLRPVSRVLFRFYSQSTHGGAPKTGTVPTQTPASPAAGIPKVPGLSNKIIKPVSGPVGPGASATGEYKVPEYFCFNRMSYYEAEVEMAKYRCPQPSALAK